LQFVGVVHMAMKKRMHGVYNTHVVSNTYK
jgi:hypothetical protein